MLSKHTLLSIALIISFLGIGTYFFYPSSETTESIVPKSKKKADSRRAKDDFKKDRPDLYHAAIKMLKTKYGEKSPSYPNNYRSIELAKANSALRKAKYRVTSYQWEERGPSNVPGRTRGLVFDPRDASQNTWFAGSVGGGVWKTTNGGNTWIHLTPDMPNLAIGSLAISASNPDVLYAGTGENGIDGVGVTGDGMYKSTDGGTTWVQLESTVSNPNFQNVNRIIVDPQNENILVAAVTSDGEDFRTIGSVSSIYRSEDGGASWTRTYLSEGFSIEQIVANPKNFNIQYATINRKGIIKSIDGGKTWNSASNGIGQVGRIEMAVARNNPNILYASCEGTLSGNNSDLYVSEDGGQNWMLVVEEKKEDGSAGTNPNWLGSQGWYDNTIMVHPFNDQIVYVGGIGIWMIERKDGQGESINAVTGIDMIDTQSFLYNEVRFFTDNGTNLQTGDFTGVEIRFGAGKKQKAHRFTVPAGSTSGVPASNYTYRDYVDVPFEVWDITNNRQLMVSFRDQAANGKYDLVDDFNVSREYIFVHALPYSSQPSSSIAQNGGHTFRSPYLLWMRMLSGLTFDENNLPNALIRINYQKINTVYRKSEAIADPYLESSKKNTNVHPDQHNLVAQIKDNTTFRILNANDGGVYVTDYSSGNAGFANNSWKMVGNTYNSSQFYGADKKPNANVYIGGTQDNGTWVTSKTSIVDATTTYRDVWGGDGFEAVWSGNPNKVMFSSQFNNIGRNLDGFASNNTEYAINGITDSGPFISRLTAHKKDHDLVFTVGSSGVWRTDNFGDDWKLALMDDNWSFSSLNTPVKVSQANPQVVWAGAAMYANLSPQVSRDGGLTFQKTTVYGDLGNITDFGTHPFEEGTAYVLLSQYTSPKVLRTKDFGQTWEDISGYAEGKDRGFPNVPVFSLVVLPHQPQTIWVGTEIGIFESTNDGESWHKLGGNFPAVLVWDLKIVDDQVIAATHGRGIWTVTIPELLQAPQNEVVLSPRIDKALQSTFTSASISVYYSLRSAYDSTQVLSEGKRVGVIAANNSATQGVFSFETKREKYQIALQLVAFKNGKIYPSAYQQVIVYSEPISTYFTSFEDTNDFLSDETFGAFKPDGFTDNALHSLHPYPDQKDLIAYFLKPIIVSGEYSKINYKDIAIVEIGEPNSVFGQEDFYDYVVVEGSKNGKDWIPLKAGYDARINTKWQIAYENEGSGTENMFVNQEIDLRDTFLAGDVVIIRFRLYADPATHAWGWAIDDLSIQDKATSVEDNELSKSILLYPNPSQGKFEISLQNLSLGSWQVQIFDVKGRMIANQIIENQHTQYEHSFDLNNQPKGQYFIKLSNGKQVAVKKLLIQ
ncbi:MAG: hypothetical protein OHK0038_01560 [Flammeovirgaceae bacterium]